uniref:Uncharacterized protein n=1 Tax=Zea mays TaxID=4577 RepID=A0A804MDT7_MAIZE
MDQRPDAMNRTVMEQVETKGKHNSCERARSIDRSSQHGEDHLEQGSLPGPPLPRLELPDGRLEHPPPPLLNRPQVQPISGNPRDAQLLTTISAKLNEGKWAATTFAGEGAGGEKSSLALPVSWRSRKDPSRRSRLRLHLDLPPPAESLGRPPALALRFGLAMRKSVEELVASAVSGSHAPPRGTLLSGDQIPLCE